MQWIAWHCGYDKAVAPPATGKGVGKKASEGPESLSQTILDGITSATAMLIHSSQIGANRAKPVQIGGGQAPPVQFTLLGMAGD